MYPTGALTVPMMTSACETKVDASSQKNHLQTKRVLIAFCNARGCVHQSGSETIYYGKFVIGW